MAQPTLVPEAAPGPRRPRRLRLPRRRNLVIGGLALVVISLPAVDVTSRQVTQHLVADRMQDQLHSSARPEVHLDGTPFITQLISGRLDRVRIGITGATACKVRITHAEATLTGVRQRSAGVSVSSISGTGLLDWDDLSAAVAPLRISAGAPGQLTVSGSLGLLGFTATAAPSIEGSTLILAPTSVAATSALGSLGTDLSAIPPIHIQLRQIPIGLSVGLNPQPDGLAFTFGGHDLSLAQTGCPSS